MFAFDRKPGLPHARTPALKPGSQRPAQAPQASPPVASDARFDFGHISIMPPPVQRKATGSSPGDPFERKADVADKIMRMMEPAPISSAAAPIQRQCAKCEAEEEKEQQVLRRVEPWAGQRANELGEHADRKLKSLTSGPHVTMTPDTVFRAATQGPSQAIPYRQDMEAVFGERFDDVRAYLGRAGEMRIIGAEAATRGTSVAFRDTYPARETVAHELTHVVQQRRPEAMSSSSSAALSQPEEPTEREATQVAARAARGQPVEVKQSVGGRISRQTAATPADAEKMPAPEMPASILAEVEAMLEDSEEKPDDSSLTRLGQMAVRLLGPHGVVGVAQEAGVPGAERREQELERESDGTIHRQAAEAAGTVAGTMWWLTLVDGPLPVGDIIYGALILAAALTAAETTRRIGKGDCYAGRSCDGKILGRRIKHCHNCKNYFSGRSILHPNGTCERC
jgi:hypothetical protein